MMITKPTTSGERIISDGIVRSVDAVGRELKVDCAGIHFTVDVRRDCLITLRGERVKLRLLQPRDRVRVSYTECRGNRIAATIEVQPNGPEPS
jgi:hypothetical protein